MHWTETAASSDYTNEDTYHLQMINFLSKQKTKELTGFRYKYIVVSEIQNVINMMSSQREKKNN